MGSAAFHMAMISWYAGWLTRSSPEEQNAVSWRHFLASATNRSWAAVGLPLISGKPGCLGTLAVGSSLSVRLRIAISFIRPRFALLMLSHRWLLGKSH